MRVGRDWLGGSCVVRFVSIGVRNFFLQNGVGGHTVGAWLFQSSIGVSLRGSQVAWVELLEILSEDIDNVVVLTNILEVELVNIGLVLDSLQACFVLRFLVELVAGVQEYRLASGFGYQVCASFVEVKLVLDVLKLELKVTMTAWRCSGLRC